MPYHPKRHPLPNTGNNIPPTGSASKISSFIITAFVATTTASVSYAAYYSLSSVALFSALAGIANGEEEKNGSYFKEEIKKDDVYGYTYVGFDTYPGIHLDDGTGVATNEVKVASLKNISKALDAAGLDENGIIKNANGEHITLHPMHAHRTTCPIYGCPLLPLDIHYQEEVKTALEKMKKETSRDDSLLHSSGCETAATLTLIGYKGGKMPDQINQDRALVYSPYKYYNIGKSSSASDESSQQPVARLLGAFDGHARYGEKVSEYVAKTLPALLGSKLVDFDASPENEVEREQKMGQLLRDTFLELDATSPANPSGGCTASVVLQLGSKIYVANAGDSRSFIAVHVIPPDGTEAFTSIIHGTREDKPHLSIEQERVEHMGGTVYLPNGFAVTGQGTTRVLYKDPTTGSTSGLAMSRSIGDWDAGEVGVVPDPVVDILDIGDIKKTVLAKLNSEEVEIDASGETKATNAQCLEYSEKDIKVFAISASDGLLDYVEEDTIAKYVAIGLYSREEIKTEEGARIPHPLTACEKLIYTAANGWQNDKGGRYRDDIAIAIADLG